MDITISEDITPILLEKLRETALDMAIVALPVQRAELMRQEILRERLYLVASSNHALCRGGSACLKDLAAEPFLLLREGHCFRDTAIAACKQCRLRKWELRYHSGHGCRRHGHHLCAGNGSGVAQGMQVYPHRGRTRATASGSSAITKQFPLPAPARVHAASFCVCFANHPAKLFCGSRDLSPDLRKLAAVACMTLRKLGGATNRSK